MTLGRRRNEHPGLLVCSTLSLITTIPIRESTYWIIRNLDIHIEPSDQIDKLQSSISPRSTIGDLSSGKHIIEPKVRGVAGLTHASGFMTDSDEWRWSYTKFSS